MAGAEVRLQETNRADDGGVMARLGPDDANVAAALREERVAQDGREQPAAVDDERRRGRQLVLDQLQVEGGQRAEQEGRDGGRLEAGDRLPHPHQEGGAAQPERAAVPQPRRDRRR